MTISKDLAKLIVEGINRDDLEARGDWLIEYKGRVYKVEAKKFKNKVEYRVKDDNKILVRYQLMMVEV